MLTISPINFNRQTHAKNNRNRTIIPIKNDSFELRSKSNISFGAIPRQEILACCDKVLKDIEKVTDCDKVRKISDYFFANDLVRLREKLNSSSKLENAYKHELINAYHQIMYNLNAEDREVLLEYYPEATTNIKYLNAQKQELKRQ